MGRHASLRLACAAAALAAGCSGDTTAPVPRLSIAPRVRVFVVRDDSVMTSADSALVVVTGPGADTLRWIATHSASAPWVSLTTTTAQGSGLLRWARDASGYFAGSYVDTITVTLLDADSTTVLLVDSLVVAESPPRYITVRRAWRPGERDSLASAIVANRSWDFLMVGDISDLAPAALAAWDSTTEVVVNPHWRPVLSTAGRDALHYDTTFGVMALDLLIVFDSLPDTVADPSTFGIQRDSLPWKMILWYKPGEESWHGFVVRSTPLAQWNSNRTVKTVAFNDAYGHPDETAAGEARFSTGTYWEGDGGGFKLSFNGNYGTIDTVETGPFTGANVYYGQMTGSVQNLNLVRLAGSDPPNPQYWSATWTLVNSQRIRCYWPPIPPPTGFTQCTGGALADILAATRSFRTAGARVRAQQAGAR